MEKKGMSATQLCLIKLLMAIPERIATSIKNKIKERKEGKRRKNCKMTLSEFRKALNAVVTTLGKKEDSSKKEMAMVMQTSMNRNQEIKKVEKEDRKTEKGSTKENGNYTNRRRTPYYQEQGRYNPPREWRENQGYSRGS